MKSKGISFKKVLAVTAVLLLIAAAAFAGVRMLMIRKATAEAKVVLDTMYQVIPGLGADIETSGGQGRDPLASLTIEGRDIVGCLEVPAIDLTAPVTQIPADGEETDAEPGFAAAVSGSPVSGRFMLDGSRKDVFRRLTKLQPGDTVAFTDIDGNRYSYRVTTQFHLKKWDEADHDLMLTFKTDDDTRFVVGCTNAF